MKSNKIKIAGYLSIALLLTMYSCSKVKKETFELQSDLSKVSQIQVFMAMVNASRNYVYVDAYPITGALMSTGSVFPSGTGTYASAITTGVRAFVVRDTLSATTQIPLSFAENMMPGKNYTIFVYDTITTPKQKTVLTDIVIPSDTTARIRFANFIYNPVAVPAIDIFSFNRNANIFTNVAVTDVTGFIPYPSGLTSPTNPDTLYVRETGTLINILKVPLTLTQKRSYTLVYRGSHRGTRLTSLFTNY